jgi:uncharacterized CHY-type Zn-finger protein
MPHLAKTNWHATSVSQIVREVHNEHRVPVPAQDRCCTAVLLVLQISMISCRSRPESHVEVSAHATLTWFRAQVVQLSLICTCTRPLPSQPDCGQHSHCRNCEDAWFPESLERRLAWPVLHCS